MPHSQLLPAKNVIWSDFLRGLRTEVVVMLEEGEKGEK